MDRFIFSVWFMGHPGTCIDMAGKTTMDKQKSGAPDNTLTMEINGTKYLIHEFFGGNDTIDDIITKRVMSDLNPPYSNDENP